jgi:probable phosphoglycerate mutase
MVTFYFVRHGLKEAVPFDPPLTTIGIEQAKAAADLLKNVEFKEILASPKTRTKQTAELIAKHHSLKITFDKRLLERMEWEENVKFEEFIKEWNKTDLDRNYIPKKGMGSFANGIQMRNLIEELAKKHTEGNVLIVTHGGTIADLLRNLFGEENLPHIISTLTNAKYIDIAECSITTIQNAGGEYKLLKLGDISHLSIPLT